MTIRKVERVASLVPVNNVVITVSDKTGLDVLVPELIKANPRVHIYSTGGTYTKINEMLGENAKHNVQEVSKYTGQPETEGGLVKTLHHKLFLGYLTEEFCPEHSNDLKRENAKKIDMFVGNFYPFEKTIAREGVDIEDARGNIDVGGPSALRAAAKNWHRVAAVIDPADYELIIKELQETHGFTTIETRFELHKKVFRVLSNYDNAIANYLDGVSFEKAIEAYSFQTIVNRRLGE